MTNTTSKKRILGKVSMDDLKELRRNVEANLQYIYEGRAEMDMSSDEPNDWMMTVPVFVAADQIEGVQHKEMEQIPSNKKLH